MILRTLLVSVLFSTVACAQTRTIIKEPKITLGWTTFIDEAPIDHLVAGGSVRFYVTRRIGIEPELLYLKGPHDDRDLTFMPHFTYDFGNSKRRIPYVTVGAGFLHHSDKIGLLKFTHTEWTVSGGVGIKVFLTDKIFFAPEFRMGFEPIVRATGSIGFVF